MSSLYTRTCVSCGEKSTVSYKPTGKERCGSCAKREDTPAMARKRYENVAKITYTYFCPRCPIVVVRVATKKTNFCQDCNRRKKPKSKFVWSYDTMRYFKICVKCGDCEKSTKRESGWADGCHVCDKPKRVKKPKSVKKQKKVQQKKYDQEAIMLQRKLNKVHREAEAKPKLITQTKSEEDMKAEWLAKNKPTIIAPTCVDLQLREVRL